MGERMRKDFYFESCGKGNIHCCEWLPNGQIRAVLQIVHGIAEHVYRYDHFANFLNSKGIAVVAHDHMGHGKSIGRNGIRGYFHGGWFHAVEDAYRLLQSTQAHFPGVPYILFGHSMGSFVARTILMEHPDCKLSGAIICGSAWQSKAPLAMALPICRLVCKIQGEQNESAFLQSLCFGSYNKRIEHPRTSTDWLSRDYKQVDAYNADPLCGFTATAGLYRDMLTGIAHIQKPEQLAKMDKELPVYLVAGGDDPVGNYGSGMKQLKKAFEDSGMKHVSLKLYPLCRHEILNEINRDEVYEDTFDWIVHVLR